jgi:iron uptake system component EfeO
VARCATGGAWTPGDERAGRGQATVDAGQVTFIVTNVGADRVTEVELESHGTVLGEKEDLVSGLSGDFSVRLDPGKYEVTCPGARQPSAPVRVTG